MTERNSGAKTLLKALEHEGVEVIFGIPGGASMPIYDPLVDRSPIRHVLCRHEQGAGHAAEGYAWATGKVGVCMATSGPGATNLVTPLADAKMDSVPIVAITGQVPTPVVGSWSPPPSPSPRSPCRWPSWMPRRSPSRGAPGGRRAPGQGRSGTCSRWPASRSGRATSRSSQGSVPC